MTDYFSMPGPLEADEDYPEIKSRQLFAWLPKQLRSGGWAWLCTLYYREYIYYSHIGEEWINAAYYTPDEVIMLKLKGE